MTPSFSIYLEIVRITATSSVFIAHSSSFYKPLIDLNEEAKLGRDGVVIFFVLSGYVISCVQMKKKDRLSFSRSIGPPAFIPWPFQRYYWVRCRVCLLLTTQDHMKLTILFRNLGYICLYIYLSLEISGA